MSLHQSFDARQVKSFHNDIPSNKLNTTDSVYSLNFQFNPNYENAPISINSTNFFNKQQERDTRNV